MQLSEAQCRFLRGAAHPLKPVIMIGGNGLTDAVARETERALEDHELIKVRVRVEDREARDAIFAELATRTRSTLVQRIGHVGVLYRRNGKAPKLIIPD